SDSGGAVGFSAARTFSVDRIAPAVTLTSPADGEFLTTATPTFGGAAGNAAGDLGTITVKIYPGTGTTRTPVRAMPTPAGGSGWLGGASELADGPYTAQAFQSDAAGNVGSSASITFTIDGPPVVFVNTPRDAFAFNTPLLFFSGTAGSAADDVPF